MRDYYEGEGAVEVHFFHVSTDGRDNGAVHFCDADYQYAVIVSAIVAYQCGVKIICYCHMTTHSHFLIRCDSFADALRFIKEYKRRYAQYVSQRYGERKILKDVGCTPVPVRDLFHLRNCVSYILLNPVVAGICRTPEEYKWSSFETYFNNAPLSGRHVSELGVRECRTLLHTRQDLLTSGLMIDAEGNVEARSFVDCKFVERLFGSKTGYYRSLALTDCAAEEEKFIPHNYSFSETEVIAEFLNGARKLYGKESLHLLTKPEKYRLLIAVRKKMKVTPRRIARILRLKVEEVEAVLGK